MSEQHPNSKFTFKVEHNRTFSFLDTQNCRENDKLTIAVYRRPTFGTNYSRVDQVKFVEDSL